MILFYNKDTLDIHAIQNGREHSPEEIKSAMVKPSNMAEEQVGKAVIEFSEGQPMVQYKDIILAIESGQTKAWNCKVVLDEAGNVINVLPKV